MTIVIAEFRVDGSDLLLSSTLKAVPEMSVEIEQHTASGSGNPIFFFWAYGGDFYEFDAALETDESVDEGRVLEDRTDSRLYRVAFTRPSYYDLYRETAAKILELRGDRRGWHMRMRFPNRDAFNTYQAAVTDDGTTFELTRLYTMRTRDVDRPYGLTEPQYEALVNAYEHGYFDDPRSSSLEELAAVLEISPRAVAGRLRRGHANLIANTIITDRQFPTLAKYVYEREED